MCSILGPYAGGASHLRIRCPHCQKRHGSFRQNPPNSSNRLHPFHAELTLVRLWQFSIGWWPAVQASQTPSRFSRIENRGSGQCVTSILQSKREWASTVDLLKQSSPVLSRFGKATDAPSKFHNHLCMLFRSLREPPTSTTPCAVSTHHTIGPPVDDFLFASHADVVEYDHLINSENDHSSANLQLRL